MRSHRFLFLLWFTLSVSGQQKIDTTVSQVVKLMGSRFEITVVAPSTELGTIYIEEAIAEIERVEALLSSWDRNSQTSEINRQAGKHPVQVDAELFDLIERAKQISKISDGAFDISYASMDKIWKFDGSMTHAPTDEAIRESVRLIDYQDIELNKDSLTVFLKKEGMKIGFGAIGKGYAADRAKALLVSKQVKGGIINASGDLTTWGTQASGKKWFVGITNPLKKDKVFTWMPVLESSVATSGNYEKFVTFKGKRYSHIIDPRTGYPTHGISSVTIFAKKAELCDALATAVFIMGKEAGMAMIEQLPGTEAIVVDTFNKIHQTRGITFSKNP
ncbi:FAD:protein FMN transferase [Sediminicola luteus]|uniref:FAD:protein FMN transferase n=1 Tax=Sediminicola luteus TaxID=319238 RepID=A0A2A4G8L6_9FLAO|nr:FAD:protein FMN transferase [Sediminicola luteus]PCE64336.1 thiamine biosynthesis protein ApbE [Sediminicola luteus]